jgi:hypothetical protein
VESICDLVLQELLSRLSERKVRKFVNLLKQCKCVEDFKKVEVVIKRRIN